MSSPQQLCNTVWLIIINCFSSLKGKFSVALAETDGLNQKMTQALTTPNLLAPSDEADIKAELESIEDATDMIVHRIVVLQERIQRSAEAYNQKK